MHYWLTSPHNKNFINNRFWVYNTYAQWQKYFKFWSLDTIKRIFLSLEHKQLIVSGNFNIKATDRTKWYTIDYEQVSRLENSTLGQVAPLQRGNLPCCNRAKSADATEQLALMYNKEQRLHTKNTTYINKPTKNKQLHVTKSNDNEDNQSCLSKAVNIVSNSDQKTTVIYQIFSYWKTHLNHLAAKLDRKRKKYILYALDLGYTIEELYLAIRGVKVTPYNMGKNDRGEVYDDFHIIFKDAAQIERFIRNASNPPTVTLQNLNKSFLAQDAEIRKNALVAQRSSNYLNKQFLLDNDNNTGDINSCLQ
jgi:hypothetical protein